MVSILAFDTLAIKSILDDSQAEHFRSEEYPIFYKN